MPEPVIGGGETAEEAAATAGSEEDCGGWWGNWCSGGVFGCPTSRLGVTRSCVVYVVLIFFLAIAFSSDLSISL